MCAPAVVSPMFRFDTAGTPTANRSSKLPTVRWSPQTSGNSVSQPASALCWPKREGSEVRPV